MQTEEEIESWYQENKQKVLEKLLASLENKENVDETEMRYTKDLKNIFENYKKKMLEITEAPVKRRNASNSKLPSIFKNLLLPIKIFKR